MQEYDLSIIIPHFQNAVDLKRLLASISDDKRFETIIVDDYSDDKSFNQVQLLQDKFSFKLIKNTGKKNAGTCRNIGIAQARGKWILFADSDDFFLGGWKENVSAYFESDADIVFFSPTSIYDGTSELSDRHVPHASKILKFLQSPSIRNEFALRLSWNCPWSKLYRLEFLRKNSILFDEVIATNDAMFSLKSGVAAEKIQVSTKSFYCCVARRGSLEYSYTKEILAARLRVGMAHLQECEKIGFAEFGDDALGWFYRIRFLKLKEQLYLIKVAKKIGLLKRLSFSMLIDRFVRFVFRRKNMTNGRLDRLLVIK